jgi:uncharacterized protein
MLYILVLAFLIVFAAAVTQAVTGFGFALVSVPLLTLLADPRTAVVACAVAGLVLTVTVAARERAFVQWRTAGLLFAAAVLGMPAGLLILVAAPERVLTLLIGIAVVACALLVWRGWRLSGGWLAVVGVGMLTGVLSTSTATSGPPLVAALHAMGLEPRSFRATLAAVFTGTGSASVAGFALADQLTPVALRIGLVGVPAVVLGWWGGNVLFHRIDARRFRQVAFGALMAAGTVILTRAMIG